MSCLMKVHMGPFGTGTRGGHTILTGCPLKACGGREWAPAQLGSLLPSGAGQEEAKGYSWQGCRKECLRMSKKLLSCALLAEPLRGSLLQRKYCNTAEMLKGQGQMFLHCLPYLGQSPAPRHSYLGGKMRNSSSSLYAHRFILNEAQAHVGKPKPPPGRRVATLSHQSAGRTGAGPCLWEAAWLWKWPCWASFLRYMGSRDNTKFTSHPCGSFQIQKPGRLRKSHLD